MMVGWMRILNGSCGIEAETDNYAEKERVGWRWTTPRVEIYEVVK